MTTTIETLRRDDAGPVVILGERLTRTRGDNDYTYHSGKVRGWNVAIAWFRDQGWRWDVYPVGMRGGGTIPSVDQLHRRIDAEVALSKWLAAATKPARKNAKRAKR